VIRLTLEGAPPELKIELHASVHPKSPEQFAMAVDAVGGKEAVEANYDSTAVKADIGPARLYIYAPAAPKPRPQPKPEQRFIEDFLNRDGDQS
jgi:hypothetical protein